MMKITHLHTFLNNILVFCLNDVTYINTVFTNFHTRSGQQKNLMSSTWIILGKVTFLLLKDGFYGDKKSSVIGRPNDWDPPATLHANAQLLPNSAQQSNVPVGSAL